jgi:DsbC/DsbD-like thiol-disulfide interchange protein
MLELGFGAENEQDAGLSLPAMIQTSRPLQLARAERLQSLDLKVEVLTCTTCNQVCIDNGSRLDLPLHKLDKSDSSN